MNYLGDKTRFILLIISLSLNFSFPKAEPAQTIWKGYYYYYLCTVAALKHFALWSCNLNFFDNKWLLKIYYLLSFCVSLILPHFRDTKVVGLYWQFDESRTWVLAWPHIFSIPCHPGFASACLLTFPFSLRDLTPREWSLLNALQSCLLFIYLSCDTKLIFSQFVHTCIQIWTNTLRITINSSHLTIHYRSGKVSCCCLFFHSAKFSHLQLLALWVQRRKKKQSSYTTSSSFLIFSSVAL